MPLTIPRPACFRAHKNATDQTGIVDQTWTTLTFGTEVYDIGGYFASDTWTPPAGPIAMTASAFASAGVTASNLEFLGIWKNGALFAYGSPGYAQATNVFRAAVSASDLANGTDAYIVRVFLIGGPSTVSGAINSTWFEGRQL